MSDRDPHPQTTRKAGHRAGPLAPGAVCGGTLVRLPPRDPRPGLGTFPRLGLLDAVSEAVFAWGPGGLEPLNDAADAFVALVGDGTSLASACFVDLGGRPLPAASVPLLTRPDGRRRDRDVVLGAVAHDGTTAWSRMTVRKTAEPGVSRQPLMVITVCDVTGEHVALQEATSIASIADKVDVHVYRGTIERSSGTFHETYANPAIAHCIGGELPDGVDPDALWRSLLHTEDGDQMDRLHARLSLGQDARAVYRLVGLDGVVRWFVDRAHVTRMTDDEVLVEGTVTDISEYKAAQRTLEHELSTARWAASTDPLTGLFERRSLLEQMTDALQVAVWDGSDVGLLMIDVDRFRRVNEAFGQSFGDLVLQRVAEVLLGLAGPDSVVCRWGGEEFVVLVPDCATVHQLRRLAERFCKEIASERHDGALVQVTVSIGAALASQSGRGPEALLQAAERALARAKRSGRNRVTLVNDAETEVATTPLPDLTEVARALAGAASLREGVSDEHMCEVATLSSEIAYRLGLDGEATTRTRLGAWLHDVGKVAVAESILCKPGRLDKAELAEMRRHAEVGAAFAGEVPGLEGAGPGILHHHEAWDGSGYPHGLMGAGIPIEARIIAAADTFSAITQDRCYQVARTPEVAADELLRAAGRTLDPEVVEVLLQILVDTGRINARPTARTVTLPD